MAARKLSEAQRWVLNQLVSGGTLWESEPSWMPRDFRHLHKQYTVGTAKGLHFNIGKTTVAAMIRHGLISEDFTITDIGREALRRRP